MTDRRRDRALPGGRQISERSTARRVADSKKKNESEDDVLASVQQFANGVEVAGVDRRLDQDVHEDRAQVREGKPRVTPPVLGLLGGIVQLAGRDYLVGPRDGGAVGRKHVRGRLLGINEPVTVVGLW